MVSRADVVNGVLSLFENPEYLEIGVNKGETFFAIEAANKTAVDPKFWFDVETARNQNANSSFYEITSDEYFCNAVTEGKLFDVIYLDGLHTFEQTLRDLNNSLVYLKAGGVVVIDDVKPNSYDASLPDIDAAFALKAWLNIKDGSWMGDTFKLMFFIDTFMPQYSYRTVKDNHGQGIVWKSRRDWSSYPLRTVSDITKMSMEHLMQQASSLNEKLFADIRAELLGLMSVQAHLEKTSTLHPLASGDSDLSHIGAEEV